MHRRRLAVPIRSSNRLRSLVVEVARERAESVEPTIEPGHEEREDGRNIRRQDRALVAAMEPGHEHREDLGLILATTLAETPQWNPVMTTGKTDEPDPAECAAYRPQWSPVVKTGKTRLRPARGLPRSGAAMEPGREDREDADRGGVGDGRRKRRNGARS